MTHTKATAATEVDPTAREPIVTVLARWIFLLHAALLAAQPFLAGALLDAMSPTPQQMHRFVAMALVAVGFVQIFIARGAWKSRAAWPKAAYTGSIMLWLIELVQFSLGHLSLGMAVHLPLGIVAVAFGLYLAWRFCRRAAQVLPAPPLAP